MGWISESLDFTSKKLKRKRYKAIFQKKLVGLVKVTQQFWIKFAYESHSGWMTATRECPSGFAMATQTQIFRP
jgi:hypothetical protein